MPLRVAEFASLTDVGRQRQSNEDSFLEQPPVFAVADGMGGARAGEVASRLAVDAFGQEQERGGTPEERLERIATTANRRIFEMAQQDESRAGMGTTLTAAIAGERDVTIGHVGDSRLYRLRGGELERLTDDHSLVGELVRQGKLTEEEAEVHPQRSIITRALGPEAEVEVETLTYPAQDGDVYLLCSDGLTGMVSEREIEAVLAAGTPLTDSARQLVDSANEQGGRDNITVVLFRLGDSEAADGADGPGGETMAALSAEEVRSAVAERKAREAEAEPDPEPPRHAAPPKARRRPRAMLATLGTLLLVAVAGAAAYAGGRQVFFLGTDERGLLTVYRGLPYELPLGIELYQTDYRSGVPASALDARRRGVVLDHTWRSRDDARDLMRDIERSPSRS